MYEKLGTMDSMRLYGNSRRICVNASKMQYKTKLGRFYCVNIITIMDILHLKRLFIIFLNDL